MVLGGRQWTKSFRKAICSRLRLSSESSGHLGSFVGAAIHTLTLVLSVFEHVQGAYVNTLTQLSEILLVPTICLFFFVEFSGDEFFGSLFGFESESADDLPALRCGALELFFFLGERLAG